LTIALFHSMRPVLTATKGSHSPSKSMMGDDGAGPRGVRGLSTTPGRGEEGRRGGLPVAEKTAGREKAAG